MKIDLQMDLQIDLQPSLGLAADQVALALVIELDSPSSVPRVVWMGGVVYAKGNVTPVPETGGWHDPEAPQMVP